MTNILLILTILISFTSQAEDVNDCSNSPIDREFGQRASEITKDCSADKIYTDSKSTDAPLASYFDVPNDKMCTCLEKAKFNEIRVPDNRVKDFKQWEYDQSIREKLKASFNDMVANFSKFNNLILTKEHLGNLIDEKEISQAGGYCNIDTVTKRIEELQKVEGTDACPSPKGFMQHRLTEIFGTTNMKDLPGKLKKNLDEVDKNSCIPQSLFLNLRSSNGASGKGFEYLLGDSNSNTQEIFKSHFNNPAASEKAPLKDLLSYDVFFNLAYRDKDFYERLQKNMTDREKDGARRWDIYNDKETLKSAYTSINKSCNDLSKNLQNFLCANEYPRMKPATLNMHLDDYFKDDKTEAQETKNSMRDHFTWDYSCNSQRNANTYRRGVVGVLKGAKKEAVELSPEEKDFNDFIETTILVKNSTKQTLERDKDSDYAKFNESFCGDKKGKTISVDDLPAMTKDFLAKLANGKDVGSILNDPKLALALGLRIDTTVDPIEFSVTNPKSISNGKLPNISPEKWNSVMVPELLKKMSQSEIDQLYVIIEMQTNRKYTEMEDLKFKLAKENKAYKELTLSEIDRLVKNKDPKINEEIKSRLLASGVDPTSSILQTDFNKGVNDRYAAQKSDQVEKLDYAKDVFFNDRKVEDIKTEAKAYTENKSTFDKTYASKSSSGKNDNGTPEWGNFNSSKNPGSGTTSNPSNETTPQTKTTSSETGTNTPSQTNTNSQSIKSNPSSTQAASYTPPASQNSNLPSNSDFSSSSNTSSKSTPQSNSKPFKKDGSIKDEIARIKEKYKKNDFEPSQNSNRPTANNNPDKSYRPSGGPSGAPFSNSGGSSFAASGPRGEAINETATKASSDSSKKDSGKSSVGGTDAGGGSRGPASAGPTSAAMGSVGGADLSKVASALDGINPNIAGDINPEDENLTPEQYRKKYGIPIYEFHKIIPSAILEVTGSVENLVVILGLEGQSWKLLELVEKNGEEKYFLTDYDFLPEGEFETDKEKFATKEGRVEFYNAFFTYPKNKDNLQVSKKLAKFTKKLKRYEVTPTFIKQNQSKIMNDEELKTIVYKLAEKLK